MTLEYGGRADGTRRSKMRIPGGPGARKQSMKAEDYADPATSKGYSGSDAFENEPDYRGENKDSSHPDDLAVLDTMRQEDAALSAPLEEEPPVGGTQYDQLMYEAQEPTSPSFTNGKRVAPITEREIAEARDPEPVTEGEMIADTYTNAQNKERASYLEERADRQESKDIVRNGLLWLMGRRRGNRHDDKTKKRGGRAA